MKCSLSQVKKPCLIYYLSRNYQVNLVSIELFEVFWVTIINKKKLTCAQTLVHFTFRIKTMMNRRPHLIWCKVPFSPFFFAVTFWNTQKKICIDLWTSVFGNVFVCVNIRVSSWKCSTQIICIYFWRMIRRIRSELICLETF